jgi:hypothetical protein
MTVSDMVSTPASAAEGKARATAQSRRTFAPWLVGVLIAAALLGTVAFEYGTYQHYFKRYIAPYYPVNDDQLETYQWAYNNSVVSQTGTLQQGRDKAIALPNKREVGLNMKGCIVPLLSLGATLLLGPQRFSVGLINLVYLIVGQIVLFFAMRRRSGIRPALLASGLFLMSTSHYYYAGGINDMRLDYAGLIMMGMTYLAVLQTLESGKRKDLIVSAACLLLCAMTRSILLIYWLGTILSAFVIFGGAELLHKTAALKQFRQRCGLVLTCIAAVGALYIAVNWRDFASYYINCKTGGEDAMRRRENHIENVVQLLMYYPNSFWLHFQTMLVFALGATCATLFGFLVRYLKPFAIRLSPNSNSNKSRLVVGENQVAESLTASEPANAVSTEGVIHTIVTPPVVLLFGVVAAVLVCVTSYVPSPLVIGVLTMPLCISLALAIERLMQLSKVKLLPMAIAASIAIAGLCHFSNQFRYPIYIPHQDLPEAKAVNHIFDVMIPRVNQYHRGIEILWSLVHGGLNEKAFEIYSWEHHHPVKVPVDARYVACYPEFSWPAYARQLKDADIVVAPVELAAPKDGQFEYDGMKSMRENLPKMLEALKADGFVRLGTYQLHQPSRPPVIGVFQKETH